VKRILLIALASTTLSGGAWAQNATGIGVGTGVSRSDSKSQAVAISGQGGSGTGVGTVNIGGTPSAQTIHTTVENTGTSTIKNVPSVFSPGLAAAGLETCLGSVSGGGAFVGTGFSFGTTIPDPGCAARLDARTLWSMGLKKAAIARLCLGTDIRAAMPEVCAAYLPDAPVAGYAVAPRGYYLSAGESYQGGPIMLTDGKTGKERLCQNYDEPRHRCRIWDGSPSGSQVVMHHRAKRTEVASTPAAPTPPTAENVEGSN